MKAQILAGVFLLTGVLGSVPAQAGPVSGPNLVFNPSFEQPAWFAEQDAEGWQHRANAQRDTQKAHSGTTALKILETGPRSGYTLQNSVNLCPDTEYELSAWVWTPVASRNNGVWLEYGQTVTPPATNTAGWCRVATTFRSAAAPRLGQLRISWNLPSGSSALVDDILLTPVSGKMSPAPAPILSPDGGVFTGAVQVAMQTGLSNAIIRYTADGSEPTRNSTEYLSPVQFNGPAQVRARVFHSGYAQGPLATADFDLRPDLRRGVPFYPAGWNQDVDAWWANHIWNPASANFIPAPIKSLTPVINVADVRAKYPASDTAGIREALEQLPADGGTLFFPSNRGPYIVTRPDEKLKNYYDLPGSIPVVRRSHVHFVSDGAVLQARNDGAPIFCISALEVSARKDMQNPVRDFLFQGLVFDGGTCTPWAIWIQQANDILIENCRFQNFSKQREAYNGIINANTMTDNFWLRNCEFIGPASRAVFMDGVHNAGCVNCVFTGSYERAVFTVFANNDMAPFSEFQRSAQYFVVDGCTFQGQSQEIGSFTCANALFQNNRVTGNFKNFVRLNGRGRSNIKHELFYDGTGFRVLSNTLAGVDTFVILSGDVKQYTRKDKQQMRTIIAGNKLTDVKTALQVGNNALPNAWLGGPLVNHFEDILFTGNQAAGPKQPVISVSVPDLPEMRNVVIAGNEFIGAPQPLLVDFKGKPAEAPGVTLKDNRLAPGGK